MKAYDADFMHRLLRCSDNCVFVFYRGTYQSGSLLNNLRSTIFQSYM